MAAIVKFAQDSLCMRGAQAFFKRQPVLPGRLDLQQRRGCDPGGGDDDDRVGGRCQQGDQGLIQRLVGEGFLLGVHHRFEVVQQHHHRLPNWEGL